MNRNNNAASPKLHWVKLAGVLAVAVMSGCAAMGPADVQEPVDTNYHGASLDPDLGSVALRVADAAPRLRDTNGG